MMPWYVYIAECNDRTLYTGISTDPVGRMERHNAGRGSRYVRRRGGVTDLRYIEQCHDKPTARRRELEIKSWSRTKKLALITTTTGVNAAATEQKEVS